MERQSGKKIFGGIAIGNILFYTKQSNQVVRRKIEDTDAEIKRYEAAKKEAIRQLEELAEMAVKEVGEVNAQIFEVHAMMLEDGDYNESVHNYITSQKVNAEYAVASTGDNFASVFANMELRTPKPPVPAVPPKSLGTRISIIVIPIPLMKPPMTGVDM